MNIIKRWWNNVSGQLATEKQTGDITASELGRMLRQCPICGGGFENHDYVHFAVTVLSEQNKERIKEFFDACDRRLWEDAQKFQDFDPESDALVAYALRCQTGRLAFMIERNPYIVKESERLITCDALDEASGRRLERIIAQTSWRRMSWT